MEIRDNTLTFYQKDWSGTKILEVAAVMVEKGSEVAEWDRIKESTEPTAFVAELYTGKETLIKSVSSEFISDYSGNSIDFLLSQAEPVAKVRSVYDHSYPSPSEELMGVITGFRSEEYPPCFIFEVIKTWLENHLTSHEITRFEERDPLWDFYNKNANSNDAMKFFGIWGKRAENGQILPPLSCMNYQAKT